VPSSDHGPQRSSLSAAAPSPPRYSPDIATTSLSIQSDVVGVSCVSDELIRLTFGTRFEEALEIAPRDVTRWCAETSVLIGVTFELTGGDEVRVRSPMLVDRRGIAIAIVRRIAGEGSELLIVLGASAADLARDRQLASIEATTKEVLAFLAALESAAAAARLSRDARIK
jgi:hypothetical protein